MANQLFKKLINKKLIAVVAMFIIVALTGCSQDVIQSDIYQRGDLSQFDTGLRAEFPLWKIQRQNYRILFGGDVMIGRYVETLIKRNGEDYVFKNLNDLFNKYSDVIVNLEGPFTPLNKHRQTIDGGFIFSFPENFVSILTNNNINIVNLANNHTMNQGVVGLEDTIRILEENNIDHFGHPREYDEKVSRINANGVEILLIGFNLIENGPLQLDKMKEVVSNYRRDNSVSIIVANFHFGPEYVAFSSQSQKDFARASIDAGADIVIGHHPHVIQEIEFYNDKPIFYSLGNLIFDQYFSKETQEGFLVGMELEFKNLRNISLKNDPFVLLGGKHEVEKIVLEVIPYRSKMSQPYLLSQDEKNEWMEAFANRYKLEGFDGKLELFL